MHVSQILSSKGSYVYSIRPDAMVSDVVAELVTRRIGALVVLDPLGALVGLVSERDIVRALHSDPALAGSSVEAIMSRDIVSVGPEADVADLARLMTKQRSRHVPVIDECGELLGLVSVGDVVKVRLDELESERAALVDYITQGG